MNAAEQWKRLGQYLSGNVPPPSTQALREAQAALSPFAECHIVCRAYSQHDLGPGCKHAPVEPAAAAVVAEGNATL